MSKKQENQKSNNPVVKVLDDYIATLDKLIEKIDGMQIIYQLRDQETERQRKYLKKQKKYDSLDGSGTKKEIQNDGNGSPIKKMNDHEFIDEKDDLEVLNSYLEGLTSDERSLYFFKQQKRNLKNVIEGFEKAGEQERADFVRKIYEDMLVNYKK